MRAIGFIVAGPGLSSWCARVLSYQFVYHLSSHGDTSAETPFDFLLFFSHYYYWLLTHLPHISYLPSIMQSNTTYQSLFFLSLFGAPCLIIPSPFQYVLFFFCWRSIIHHSSSCRSRERERGYWGNFCGWEPWTAAFSEFSNGQKFGSLQFLIDQDVSMEASAWVVWYFFIFFFKKRLIYMEKSFLTKRTHFLREPPPPGSSFYFARRGDHLR